jgi:hypothetical protein
MARFQVKPLIEGFLPSHPIDGKILAEADENGNWSAWTADQFTFRLIQEGAIERVEKDEAAPESEALNTVGTEEQKLSDETDEV